MRDISRTAGGTGARKAAFERAWPGLHSGGVAAAARRIFAELRAAHGPGRQRRDLWDAGLRTPPHGGGRRLGSLGGMCRDAGVGGGGVRGARAQWRVMRWEGAALRWGRCENGGE